jgi:hypothetical protein
MCVFAADAPLECLAIRVLDRQYSPGQRLRYQGDSWLETGDGHGRRETGLEARCWH